MSVQEHTPLLNYYLRSSLHSHCSSLTASALSLRPTDPTLLFWEAFSDLQGGNREEGAREMEALEDKRDTAYAAAVAIIYFQRRSERPDEGLIADLSRSLPSAEQSVTPTGVLLTAGFHLYTGSYGEAREWIERVVPRGAPNGPVEVAAVALRGWIEIT